MQLYVFATVALLLLLVAAINYMSMATARSAKRAKEIGLRKVVGAYRGQIIRQFLVESLVISLIAAVIAVLAAEVLLPFFNQLAGKKLALLASGNVNLFMGILGMSFFVGLISGSYPALYLSRLMPSRILRDSIRSGSKSGMFRKVLVVLQFSISIIMIIGTALVFQQLQYLTNRDLGYSKEDVLVVTIRDQEFMKSLGAFKEELLRSSGHCRRGHL